MLEFKGYENGVNLGGWLSQCNHKKEHYDSFVTKEDIKELSTWGLDHLRIPVDYILVETEEGEYKEEGFKYIENAILWCREYNLNVVLDLHMTYGYSFYSDTLIDTDSPFFTEEACQERFYKLWEQFAQRFGKYSDSVCFELLNEVTKKEYCDKWNDIMIKAIKRIRVFAPDVDILTGGYYNNSVVAVKDIVAPYDDHIVYNFHCYDPLTFTHQGASWVKDMPRDFRQKFADSGVAPDYFENLFKEAIDAANERNVRLYCGEYGVIDLCDPDSTLEWYKTLYTTFKKYSIGHAAWSYKLMNFGLNEDRMSEVRKMIKNY